jgi:hypothetical protein
VKTDAMRVRVHEVGAGPGFSTWKSMYSPGGKNKSQCICLLISSLAFLDGEETV